MNSSYQVNRFYAQERVNAQLQAAEAHRQSRKARAGYGATLSGAAKRTYNWFGKATSQVASQAAHSAAALGQARVALFHR
jgi:hypothetical protein